MARKKKTLKTFRDQNAVLTKAQKRELGLLVATGHPDPRLQRSAGFHDTRSRMTRSRGNSRRAAIAFAREAG